MNKLKFYAIISLCATLALTGCKTGTAQNNEQSNIGEQTVSSEVNSEPTETEAERIEREKREAEEAAKLEAEKKAEERLALETSRKEQYKEFYVPLPALDQEVAKKMIEAKGLYVTGSVAGYKFDESRIESYAKYVEGLKTGNQELISQNSASNKNANLLEKAVGICLATEVNALVIDVKNDSGFMTYNSDVEATNIAKSNSKNSIRNIDALIELLKKHDIYAIARIVTFKDPHFARTMSKHSMQSKSGGVWHDRHGIPWVNQFDEYVWNYNVAIAKEAALKGFDEIQFDYVRFPDNARVYNKQVNYPHRNDRDKDEGIEDFLEFARQELSPYGVNIAADVFGVITRNWDDKPEDIGQTWRKVANTTEYICPMVYPSHYSTGWYGFKYPDAHPYGVLEASMKEAIEKNAAQQTPATIRPWIQGFTAGWVKGHIDYSPENIRKQILACMDLGINDYLIWDAGNTYDPRIFFYNYEKKDVKDVSLDRIERTPIDAVKKYLKAERYDKTASLYLITAIESRDKDYDTFASNHEKSNISISKYTVGDMTPNDKGYTVSVTYTYKATEKNESGEDVQVNKTLENQPIQVIKENDIWKVVPISM
jgi:hypothetical protein